MLGSVYLLMSIINKVLLYIITSHLHGLNESYSGAVSTCPWCWSSTWPPSSTTLTRCSQQWSSSPSVSISVARTGWQVSLESANVPMSSRLTWPPLVLYPAWSSRHVFWPVQRRRVPARVPIRLPVPGMFPVHVRFVKPSDGGLRRHPLRPRPLEVQQPPPSSTGTRPPGTARLSPTTSWSRYSSVRLLARSSPTLMFSLPTSWRTWVRSQHTRFMSRQSMTLVLVVPAPG